MTEHRDNFSQKSFFYSLNCPFKNELKGKLYGVCTFHPECKKEVNVFKASRLNIIEEKRGRKVMPVAVPLGGFTGC